MNSTGKPTHTRTRTPIPCIYTPAFTQQSHQNTYQRWHRVGRTFARPVAHRGDLFAGELARFHVGAQHGGQQARLIVQFGGQRALVATVLRTLLHGGQNARLLAFGNATESNGCARTQKKRKEHTRL